MIFWKSEWNISFGTTRETLLRKVNELTIFQMYDVQMRWINKMGVNFFIESPQIYCLISTFEGTNKHFTAALCIVVAIFFSEFRLIFKYERNVTSKQYR